jgi:hypothetical protein
MIRAQDGMGPIVLHKVIMGNDISSNSENL